MGLMAVSFLGTRNFPSSPPGCSTFPSRLGALQVSGALALVHANYFIMYLGLGTHFGSPGTSLGTLASWVGRGGAQIPLRMLL